MTTISSIVKSNKFDIYTHPCNKDNGKPCNKIRRHSQGCILPYSRELGDCAICYTHAFDPGILRGNGKSINAPKCPDIPITSISGKRNGRSVGGLNNPHNINLSYQKLPLPIIADCKFKCEWICDCGNGGNPDRSRYRCNHPNEKYDICTNEFVSDEFTTCLTCSDYVATNLYKNINKEQARRILKEPLNSYNYPNGWQKFKGVQEAHLEMSNEVTIEGFRKTEYSSTSLLFDTYFNYTKPTKDKVIVSSSGGNYLPGTYINVMILRNELKCDLPYEVWYFGNNNEIGDKYRELLEPLNVTFIDINTHPNRKYRRIANGFESKLFSVMNCDYNEVLYLDADVYCCQDPTKLFDNKDYRERSGCIYYPDLDSTEGWTKFDHWGVSKPSHTIPIESGVYLVNKEKCLDHLLLATHYDDRSNYYYGLDNGGHGDKECHRVALAKLGKTPTMFNEKAVWINPAFVHSDESNKPMFIHRVRSKFSTSREGVKFNTTDQNGTNIKGWLPMEDIAFKYLDQLRKELGIL